MAEWFERAFDAGYLEVYDQFEQEPIWQMDCDFLCKQIGLEPGAVVLDHCCGAGRHALELARRGMRVTGLDISPSLIAEARRRSQEQSLDVRWVLKDAREMDFDQEFDAAFNYLTSFGYGEQEDNQRILHGLHRALRPGGTLLIEMINTIWLLGNFTPTLRRVYEEFTYIERRSYDPRTGRIVTHREKADRDGVTQVLEPFSVRSYLPCSMAHMLEQAGFQVGEFVASPSGGPFHTFSTSRLAILAQRPA
jgi:ubiquinone/menaquinone biosynthesis C-methylase UbiE